MRVHGIRQVGLLLVIALIAVATHSGLRADTLLDSLTSTRGASCLAVDGTLTCSSLPRVGDTTGASDDLGAYPCGSEPGVGGERIYEFTSPASGEITFTVASKTVDPDLYVLEGTCEAKQCLEASESAGMLEQISFNADKSTTYYLVVETSAPGAFEIIVEGGTDACPELCDNGIDDDLDGPVDCEDADCAGFPGCSPYDFTSGFEACEFEVAGYPDTDVDGFGDELAKPSLFCYVLADGFVENMLDCNDGTSSVAPGLPELCDALDNDCDAKSPDGVGEPWFNQSCDGPDADLCEEGVFACDKGEQSCDDVSGDNLELCDTLDNDCNSKTPDGDDESWLGMLCDGDDADFCEEGVYFCDGGQQACDDFSGDSVEVCDNVDNDCDGLTDEELAVDNTKGNKEIAAAGCFTDGVCGLPGFTSATCPSGSYECVYSHPGYEVNETMCDGLDNDCDGEADEGFSLGGACNTEITNGCRILAGNIDGVVICDPENSFQTVCTTDEFAAKDDSICDGIDDDCDGEIDEDCPK